ncbi:ATP-binding protein [Paraburkholderia sp.]|uniref:sensor histidine kinase n=1 Tax=Paraburkholderia sp. TaxID=1926495 RepID=UPI0023A39DD4|nr:ATP-binding protein [Paraburkholderia sp.]MDE1181457.1 histidine kinase [Paraburkholderia sp.]
MDTSIVVPINAHAVAAVATLAHDPGASPATLALSADLTSSGTSSSVHCTASVIAAEVPSANQPADHPAEREVTRLRARIRDLSSELVHAQEAARRHVARELHDGVGAELTATRFALAGVETWLPGDAPPQCAAALEVANRSLDAVCEANRQAVAELHGPSLDAGIVGALAQWSGDFADRTRLRTSFVCAADVRLTRLPADAALALFRVAQEALNNVARHARATGADIRLETSRRHLTIVIADDGVGLAPGARTRRGHFGLAGIRARCAAFDGTMRISTRRRDTPSHARGTTVRARFAWDALLADARCVAEQRAEQRAAQSRRRSTAS